MLPVLPRNPTVLPTELWKRVDSFLGPHLEYERDSFHRGNACPTLDVYLFQDPMRIHLCGVRRLSWWAEHPITRDEVEEWFRCLPEWIKEKKMDIYFMSPPLSLDSKHAQQFYLKWDRSDGVWLEWWDRDNAVLTLSYNPVGVALFRDLAERIILFQTDGNGTA